MYVKIEIVFFLFISAGGVGFYNFPSLKSDLNKLLVERILTTNQLTL